MKKQNLLVLGIAVALIAAVAIFALVVPQTRTIAPDAPSIIATDAPATEAPTTAPTATEQSTEETAAPEQTAEPAATEQPVEDQAEESSVEAAATQTPVEAYLVISVQGSIYEPLPLAGEGVFTVKQDENTSNTVHVTPTSVWMEHSSCDNQDCVDQGTVSLENMEDRVLYNMIICLPNQVVLELHTPETLLDAFGVTQ